MIINLDRTQDFSRSSHTDRYLVSALFIEPDALVPTIHELHEFLIKNSIPPHVGTWYCHPHINGVHTKVCIELTRDYDGAFRG